MMRLVWGDETDTKDRAAVSEQRASNSRRRRKAAAPAEEGGPREPADAPGATQNAATPEAAAANALLDGASEHSRNSGNGNGSEIQDGPVSATAESEPGEADAGAEAGEGDETTADLAIDAGVLEALLFSTHSPLTAGRLAELMDLPATKPIKKAIQALNADYEQSGRSFRIEQVAGGYQMLTLPEYSEPLKRLHQREVDAKLTKAALETLAIVAYKQPILRAELEAIRGVACGETIRSLMEKHLVRIAGRAEEPGRPILYGTTKRFLELFGLNSLKDLPQAEELKKPGT